MHFSTLFLTAFGALVAAENMLEFINQDSTTRTIHFSPSPESANVSALVIKGDTTANVSIPTAWTGNFYSVSQGAANVPGMLGELAMDAWDGINYFDVSAIVNPDDTNGVKVIYPKGSTSPSSGCHVFPCATVYNAPDDVQTQATKETTLVVLLGTPRSIIGRSHPRHFVLHSYAHKN